MPANPDHSDAAEAAEERRERLAADWFVRRRAGLAPSEQLELRSWLGADPQNSRVFAEIERTWFMLGPPTVDAFPQEVGGRRKPRQAALVFVLSGLAIAAAGVAVIRSSSGRNYSGGYESGIGQVQRITLPDDSGMVLSAASAAEVSFDSGTRAIHLRKGEINLTVGRHPSWPLVVSVAGIEISAVGTAFDVRLLPDAVDLIVTEGKVAVTDARSGRTLSASSDAGRSVLLAGQRVKISLGPTPTVSPAEILSPAQVTDKLAWEEGRLVFHNDRLADIVEEFNRFNRHRLSIEGPQLAARRFGGAFPAAQYDLLVKSLSSDYGVSVARSSEETILRWEPPAVQARATGQLVFKFDRLADIAAAFNRANRTQIVIEGPELENRRFGGSFPAYDFEGFVKFVQRNQDLMVERRDGEIVLRSVPAAAGPQKNP